MRKYWAKCVCGSELLMGNDTIDLIYPCNREKTLFNAYCNSSIGGCGRLVYDESLDKLKEKWNNGITDEFDIENKFCCNHDIKSALNKKKSETEGDKSLCELSTYKDRAYCIHPKEKSIKTDLIECVLTIAENICNELEILKWFDDSTGIIIGSIKTSKIIINKSKIDLKSIEEKLDLTFFKDEDQRTLKHYRLKIFLNEDSNFKNENIEKKLYYINDGAILELLVKTEYNLIFKELQPI